MELSNFDLPYFLKIESGILDELNKVDINIGDRIILGIGKNVKKLLGDNLISKLQQNYKEIRVIEIESNYLSDCFAISSIVVNQEFDAIIGVGGGKVLDVCKYSAYISKKPFISIPTAIAHDGVASPIAVLQCENGVKSLGCRVPTGIIADLNVIKNSPKMLIRSGIGDILSNLIAVKDWKLAEKRGKEKVNDFAILLSNLAFTSIFEYRYGDIHDENFLRVLVEATVLSGVAMNIAGSSRPCSGSEHLLSHAMDQFENNNLHGIQVGIGSIVASYLHGMNPKKIISFLELYGLPTKLADIGFSFEDFLIIMNDARGTRKNRYTILDETDLGRENLQYIYSNCFEIRN